jgi:hypothetical protein
MGLKSYRGVIHEIEKERIRDDKSRGNEEVCA